MQDEYSKAKLLLTDAKAQFEKIGDQLGAAHCLQSLGNICHMQDEYSKAKLLLTDAKTQFEKVGDQLGAAQCLQCLGDIYHTQNEYSEDNSTQQPGCFMTTPPRGTTLPDFHGTTEAN